MTVILAITAFALIAVIAWGGMRLLQRATGCALPASSGERAADQRGDALR